MKFRSINWIKVLKIAVGCTIAILVADFIGLKYSAAAGTITLLSIGDTKRDTLRVATKRLSGFFIAVGLAYILFHLIGYRTVTFGVFLFFFVTICYGLGLQAGMSTCAVLTTHFLNQQAMTIPIILNEAMILIIGVSSGVILNLYMPDNTQMIRADMEQIEEDIRKIMEQISERLSGEIKEVQMNYRYAPERCQVKQKESLTFVNTKKHIEEATKRAYANMNNNLISDTRYYMQYIDMRKHQVYKLEQIYAHACYLTYIPEQAMVLAQYTNRISKTFHEYNNARVLLDELYKIRLAFKETKMPQTREEFENRAILYQVLQGIEEFLLLKVEFVEHLTKKQIQTFWQCKK